MLNMKKYERMTADECWNRFGWGSEAKEGTMVLYRVINGYEVFCDEMRDEYADDGAVFGCEIFKDGEMVGQWFDGSYEDAIRGAVVDAVGADVLRIEDNCEDAVNCIAHDAYVTMFGYCDMWQMDIEQVDALLGIARKYVKAHGRYFGIEWEEF